MSEYKIPKSEKEHFANPPVLTKKVKIKVHIPEELEATKTQHVWDGRRTAEGDLMGYQEVTYERSENDYPKMLFHPDYKKNPPPDIAKFVRPGMNPADYESAMALYQAELNKWNRGNRTKTVDDAKEEKRLLAKGWVDKPPQHEKLTKEFDLNSDEI